MSGAPTADGADAKQSQVFMIDSGGCSSICSPDINELVRVFDDKPRRLVFGLLLKILILQFSSCLRCNVARATIDGVGL